MGLSNHVTSLNHIYIYFTVCSRMCQNEGTLDEETCTCTCADGYSGDNCESEYNYVRMLH